MWAVLEPLSDSVERGATRAGAMRVIPAYPFNRVFCECGNELFSADEMSKHKSRHTLEYS
jgi:hypothetical protein